MLYIIYNYYILYQTVFDADFEGLTSNADLYIFNQEDSQEQAWAYLGYVLVYAKGYVV